MRCSKAKGMQRKKEKMLHTATYVFTHKHYLVCLHVLKVVHPTHGVALTDLTQRLVLVTAHLNVLLVEDVVLRHLAVVLVQSQVLAQLLWKNVRGKYKV